MANFKKGDIVHYTVWNEDSEMEFRSGEIECQKLRAKVSNINDEYALMTILD